MGDHHSNRIRIVAVLILLVGFVFGVKLFWLQILHGDNYSLQADRQYITPQGSQFDRGTIYFKKKNGELVSAASLLRGFTIAINPKLVIDPVKTFNQISEIVPLDQAVFFAQAAKKDDPYEEIATRITEEQAAQVKKLSLPGVTLYRANARFSPAGFLAPQVIGFVSFKEKDLIGRYGLERYYNDVLSRKSGRLYVNFFAEVFTHIIKSSSDDIVTEGDIITTIEPSVQSSLQNELELIRDRWKSDRTAGIVMDPKTGQIIAMASSPGFDINNYRLEKDVSVFNNMNVESVFEMGSIVKPLIVATALDQNAITADTKYNDSGFVQVRNRTIRNFDKRGRGNGVTMQTVLNQSLNTGMVFIMQKMEPSSFVEQFSKFGFDKKTGIDLPGEIGGITGNLQTARDVELANISFGQGIAVTPIAMIRAMSALANGGKIVEPHVVDYIEYLDGTKKDIKTTEVTTIIKPETSAEITRMMVNVFDNYFEGTKKMEQYSIAGKTGTAQMANRATGGYYDDRNLHTFVGYFPAYDPKFIIFLMNEYPKEGARFSSQTLVDPFINLAKFLINYYNIPPDR
jgi:stage V sporulation protein D (sporulation-specific penicillin-binding protein)